MKQMKMMMGIALCLALGACSQQVQEEEPVETPEPEQEEVVDEACKGIYMNDDGTVTVEWADLKADEEYLIYVTLADEAGNYNRRENRKTYKMIRSSSAIPLIQDGDYKIEVRQITERYADGSQYEETKNQCIVHKDHVQVEENYYYLRSNAEVNWNDNDPAILKAKELTQNATTDYEKLVAIWTYIKNTFDYDVEKVENYDKTIIKMFENDINTTFEQNKGVCIDLATLQAAMLRSVGVPCKLIVGGLVVDGNIGDHAWNEVLIDGEWQIVDVTNDLKSLGWNVINPIQKNEQDSTFIKVDEY